MKDTNRSKKMQKFKKISWSNKKHVERKERKWEFVDPTTFTQHLLHEERHIPVSTIESSDGTYI